MTKIPKIMLVEDDPTIREMYRERLRKEKMEVFTVESGDEAVDNALKIIPDVILLDLFLPRKGGLSILEVLKTQPATKNIPVVILTAYPRDEYKDKSMRNGANSFLSKSEVTPGEVVEKVKELLK